MIEPWKMTDEERKEWYFWRHGLHVLDRKFIPGCHTCEELLAQEAIKRMMGKPTDF